MLLRVQHALEVGDRVAVTVDLVEPGNIGKAELTLLGEVIRVEPDCVALRFDEPEIRPSRH